jgi:hypothetical protein
LDTYDRRDNRRQIASYAGLAGGLAGVYFGRRQLASGLLRAGEAIAGKFGSGETRFALAKSSAKVQEFLGPGGIERLAIEQVGHSRIAGALTRELNWADDAVTSLFRTQGSVSYWTSRDVIDGASKLRGQEYSHLRGLLGRDGKDVFADIQKARQFASIDKLYEATYRGRKRVPFANDTLGRELRGQLSAAQSLVEREYLQHLKQMSETPGLRRAATGQSSWIDTVFGHAGAKRLTLGELADANVRSSSGLLGARSHIAELANRHSDIGLDASAVPVHGLWKTADGRVRNVAGLPDVLSHALELSRNYFQLPLVPYFKGISPASLFPWLTGETGQAAHLLSYKNIGKQIGISDLVGGREVNVAYIGRSAIGMGFGEGADEAAVLGRGLASLDARSGYSSIEANAEDKPFSVRGWLGKQTEPSKFATARSVVGKYLDRESDYPAEVLRRLFLDPGSELGKTVRGEPRYIESLASFLKTEGSVSENVFKRLLSLDIADADLMRAVANIGDDAAVAKFFEAKAGDRSYIPLSSTLQGMVRRYGEVGDSLASEIHPRRTRGVSGFNLIGDEDPRRGIDMMRRAVMEEYILGYPAVNAEIAGSLAERVAGMKGLTESEQHEALSFIQGTTLQGMAKAEGYDAAIEAFTTTRGLRENAEWMVDNHLGVFDAHMPLPSDSDLPNVLLMRQRAGLLGSINDGIKSGRSPLEAMWDAVNGPAVGQHVQGALYGVRDPKNFTRSSMTTYFFQERLNRMLSEVGLGLGPEDLGSSFDILKGLVLKRAVPLWAGYETLSYINYEGDKLGLPSPKKLAANAQANISLLRARMFGSEHWDSLYPGLSDSVFGTVLNGSNTYEEQKEQLRAGYEPVRQGRFWFFGSRQPFMGGKIRYWLPDNFQRAYSGWESADNADLSSDDYWSHSVLPTPRYPLSPLTHFLDPYWWENKHSTGDRPDRPYVESGPLFTASTPWGPALNATIGEAIKPVRTMHPDYAPGGFTPVGYGSGGSAMAAAETLAGFEGVDGSDPEEAALFASADEERPNLYPGSYARVRTAGGMEVVGPPSDIPTGGTGGLTSPRRQLARINAALKAVGSYTTPLRLNDTPINSVVGYTGNPEDVYKPSNASRLFDNAKELTGLYGWMYDTALGNKPEGLWMADSSKATSINSRFWNMNVGGLGGELSEIGRRLIAKDPGTVEYYNPVPNDFFGSWLPGDDSFINLQRGDPYEKTQNGLMRLPGESYEKLHGVKLMQSRASSLGKSVDELTMELIHRKEPMDEEGERVTEIGNQLHKVVQKKWREQGFLKAAETEIYDEKLGVSGHIDAILEMAGERYVGEVKTMSDKRIRTLRPYSEHLDQLNFYLHNTGIDKGVLVYISREHPDRAKLFHVGYDAGRQKRVEAKLAEARSRAKGYVEDGLISRAELYDDVTRFEILSDVAPYSQEWAAMARIMANNDQISEAQKVRVQAAKKRASAQKKSVELHPYKFRDAGALEHASGVVERILDTNTLVMQDGEVVRLAGVRASNERYDEFVSENGETIRERARKEVARGIRRSVNRVIRGTIGNIPFIGEDEVESRAEGITNSLIERILGIESPADAMWRRYGVSPGTSIDYAYSEDDMDMRGKDMFRSIRAVVSTSESSNLNRELLDEGIAVEREGDYSAAGVQARFSEFEQAKGRLYEKIAHLDTPINTKFLRVRSALEEYERGHVYGTNQGDWLHPVRTYVLPTIDAYIARNPLAAAASLGLFASMFTPTRSLKLKVGGYAAMIGAGLSSFKLAGEVVSGKPWIPERVEKKRNLEEYWDILNYVKYKRLYERAKTSAMKLEHTDVEKVVTDEKAAGEIRKKLKKTLETSKAGLKKQGAKRGSEQLAEINERSKRLQEYEKDLKLGPWATQAMLYKSRYEGTLYGQGELGGGDFKQMMRAIPKYERDIVASIIKKSSQKEKDRFYALLPDYEKRVLARALRQDSAPDPMSLNDYFKVHQLPEAEWDGWNPGVDLQQLKARAIKGEKLDPMEFGIYPQTLSKAEAVTSEIEVPTLHGRSSHIRGSLESVLSGAGLKNQKVIVTAVPDPTAKSDSVSIQMNLKHDRTGDLAAALMSS